MSTNYQFGSNPFQNPWKREGFTTLEIPNQQPQPQLAGGYGTLLDSIKGITNPDERFMFMTDYMNKQNRQQDTAQAMELIGNLRNQQYEDRLKARPLEFQELVAKNLVNTISAIPGQVLAAGRMYDREALEALSYLGRKPDTQPAIRYFN